MEWITPWRPCSPSRSLLSSEGPQCCFTFASVSWESQSSPWGGSVKVGRRGRMRDGTIVWSDDAPRRCQMKIAIIGQQDFGKAVLEAFVKRGDEVAAVFCAPEKEGARPDALRAEADAIALPVHRFKSRRDPEAARAMKAAGADIGIMAFVLQFA